MERAVATRSESSASVITALRDKSKGHILLLDKPLPYLSVERIIIEYNKNTPKTKLLFNGVGK